MSETDVLQDLPKIQRIARGQKEFLQKVQELGLSGPSFEVLLRLALDAAAIAGPHYGDLDSCLSIQTKLREIIKEILNRHETATAGK